MAILARLAGAPLYIAHLTCQETLEAVRAARRRGQKVFAETCPQYLFLSQDDYERPGFEAAKYVLSPPLRERANWKVLWQALAQGELQVVATDHAFDANARDYFLKHVEEGARLRDSAPPLWNRPVAARVRSERLEGGKREEEHQEGRQS